MRPEHNDSLASSDFTSYHALHHVSESEIAAAAWRKSAASSYNGSCFEVARIGRSIGVRDTKDQGCGPVLVFTQPEWEAFLSGAKAGEFDQV
jgi:hypothetical protein